MGEGKVEDNVELLPRSFGLGPSIISLDTLKTEFRAWRDLELEYTVNLGCAAKPDVNVPSGYAVESLMRVIRIKFGKVHKHKLLCENKICRKLILGYSYNLI